MKGHVYTTADSKDRKIVLQMVIQMFMQGYLHLLNRRLHELIKNCWGVISVAIVDVLCCSLASKPAIFFLTMALMTSTASITPY